MERETGMRKRTGTWTDCLRRSCVWKTGWNRSCRMRTGTEIWTNQSQSRRRTVKTTWRNWRQRLMRLMFFDAFVHG